MCIISKKLNIMSIFDFSLLEGLSCYPVVESCSQVPEHFLSRSSRVLSGEWGKGSASCNCFKVSLDSSEGNSHLQV